jgi:WD40-like Beta Propeller Repeat
MKPIERIALLCALVVVADACSPDKPLLGPGRSKPLVADAVAEDHAEYGPWSAPVNLGPVINTAANEQHPAISRDGLSLYISSDRPGGFGGIDIWVSHRACTDVDDPACAWQTPANLGPNINSAGNDVAPTFTPDGHQLYFHSTGRGGCGLADLFVARRHDKRDDFRWEPAANVDSVSPGALRCVVNSQFADAGPTYFEDEATGITTLYFTRQNNPPTSDKGFDIYASTRIGDKGAFGPPALVPELSSPYRDTRTAIRRDGLELFLSSGRPGDDVVGHSAGSEDLWVSTRATTSDLWSPPLNLNLVNQQLGGPPINGPAFDGAPALSFDGTTLYFFSERSGGFGKRDLYMTTRTRLGGSDAAEDTKVVRHHEHGAE